MEDLERELLLISKGDELAFNSFMNRYSKRLYYHAFGILSNKEMAEEVVGDVFFEVWKLRSTLLEIASMSSWLNTIVYRKSISYLRKEVKSNQEISFEELQNFSFPDMQTPMDDMLSREEIQCLNEAINSLPPKCKHVILPGKTGTNALCGNCAYVANFTSYSELPYRVCYECFAKETCRRVIQKKTALKEKKWKLNL